MSDIYTFWTVDKNGVAAGHIRDRNRQYNALITKATVFGKKYIGAEENFRIIGTDTSIQGFTQGKDKSWNDFVAAVPCFDDWAKEQEIRRYIRPKVVKRPTASGFERYQDWLKLGKSPGWADLSIKLFGGARFWDDAGATYGMTLFCCKGFMIVGVPWLALQGKMDPWFGKGCTPCAGLTKITTEEALPHIYADKLKVKKEKPKAGEETL
jgi:hypothetical protein